jgi:superfamily II DNA or RNA helicase
MQRFNISLKEGTKLRDYQQEAVDHVAKNA